MFRKQIKIACSTWPALAAVEGLVDLFKSTFCACIVAPAARIQGSMILFRQYFLLLQCPDLGLCSSVCLFVCLFFNVRV